MSICGRFHAMGSFNGRVVVYVERVWWRGFFLNILFHEFDHMAWHLEGKPFDYDLPYWDQPHEVRAMVEFMSGYGARTTPSG